MFASCRSNKHGYPGTINGRLAATTQVGPNGQAITTTFSYDSKGRLVQTTDPANISRYFGYDARGNQILSYFKWDDPATPAIGIDKTIVTQTFYDDENRVTGTAQYTLNGDYAGTTSQLTNPDWETSTTYNAAGQVETQVDQFDVETRNIYNARGLLIETRTQSNNAAGADVWIVSRTAYDANGRAEYTVDAHEEADPDNTPLAAPGTRTVYDPAGRVVRTERLDKTLLVRLIADPVHANLLESEVDTGTITVLASSTTTYDEAGSVSTTTSPDGAITKYVYDAAGRQTQVIVDLNGDLETTADQQVTQYAYDVAGQQTSVTDALGRTTYFEYDNAGRQVAVIAPAVVDPVSETLVHPRSETVYDALGRRVAVRDNLTQTDPTDSSTINDSAVRVTSFEYDAFGRLTATILPEVVDSSPNSGTFDQTIRSRYEFAYDVYGNQVLQRDNVKVLVVQPGVPAEVVDASNARETAFTHDALGRQLTRTLPIGVATTGSGGDFVESTVYDALGRVDTMVDFEGHVTKVLYDTLGRVSRKLYYVDLAAYDNDPALASPAEEVAYTFDAFGRQVTVVDSAAGATTRAYDEFGRLKQVASPEGIVNYEYNVLGQLIRTFTSSTLAATSAITDTRYTYDSLGRLETVTALLRNAATPSGGTEVMTYYYDAIGNLDYQQWVQNASSATTLTTDYSYDAANRLTQQKQFGPETGGGLTDDYLDNGVLADYQYKVAIDGNRIHSDQTLLLDSGATRIDELDWVYDNLGRLVQEQLDSSDDALDYTTDYLFDLVGNRVEKHSDQGSDTVIDEVVSYLYDDNDRLLSEALDALIGAEDRFSVYGYGLDDLGTRQTSKTVYEGVDDTGQIMSTTTYDYDLRGRMTGVTVDADNNGTPDTISSFGYDASGTRVRQAVTEGAVTTTTLYVVDFQNPTGYSQVLEEKASTGTPTIATAPTRTYTLGHDVIAHADGPTGDVRVLLKDGHGSTRQMVEADGDVLAGQVFSYDAYGNAHGFDAATAETTIQYAGQWFEVAVGMQYLRARWYDPANGRFTSLDAFAGNNHDPPSLHKYAYTQGNPVMGYDPTGMFEGLVGTSVGSSIASFISQMNASVGQSIIAGLGVAGSFDLFDQAASWVWDQLPAGVQDAISSAFTSAYDFVAEHIDEVIVGASFTAVAFIGGFGQVSTLGRFKAINSQLAGLVDNFTGALNITESAARRRLSRAVAGTGGQAHHIIPWELRAHELVKRAARGGFDINGESNGIRLALTQHLGSHPKYTRLCLRTLLGRTFAGSVE